MNLYLPFISFVYTPIPYIVRRHILPELSQSIVSTYDFYK